MANLQGKVIVITGASSGIGAAVARALATEKVRLVLAARRMERVEEIAAECRAKGSEAIAVRCDVSVRAEVEALIRQTVGQFGRLDILLANAGYGFLARIHETTEEQFDDIMAANVKGTWYAMQAAADVMLKQSPIVGKKRASRGHIIAVSSGAARRGLPLYGVYAMTKAAQLSLAEAMRVELATDGVYVSTVHPLTTATEFFEVASSKSRLRSSGLGHAQPVAVVARKIVSLMKRPRPELWPVAGSAWLVTLGVLFPKLADWVMSRTVHRRKR